MRKLLVIFNEFRGKYHGLNIILYEGWNFNSGNYLITTDTK